MVHVCFCFLWLGQQVWRTCLKQQETRASCLLLGIYVFFLACVEVRLWLHYARVSNGDPSTQAQARLIFYVLQLALCQESHAWESQKRFSSCKLHDFGTLPLKVMMCSTLIHVTYLRMINGDCVLTHFRLGQIFVWLG